MFTGFCISSPKDASGMVSDGVNTEVTEIIPNYYHSVSDVDVTSVYFGGVGGIYRIDSESEVRIIYSASHIVGAALHGDYGNETVYQAYMLDDNGDLTSDIPQDTVLYEIPDDDNLILLTYDDEWLYFWQQAEIDEFNELASSIMRVNLQEHRIEKIYELQPGSVVYNFNVYDNSC